MSYQIDITPSALTELKALPGYVRAQAIELIDQLADTPRPPRAKELRDKPGIYRIWLAGRWRIAYEIDDEHHMLIIRRIRRKDVRDYKVASGGSGRPDSASPFNIKSRSITLGDFSQADVATLYAQHTADTGQSFTAARTTGAHYH